MEWLKDYLDEETYAKVSEQLKGKDVKIVNLKDGGYVSKEKHDNLIEAIEDKYTNLVDEHNKYKQNNSTDKYLELETKHNDTLKELSNFRNKETLSKFNVSSEYGDFVTYQANKNVTDEKDFETALKEFIEENPKYSGEITRVSASATVVGDATDSKNLSPTAKANNALRDLRNKK